MKFVVTVCHHKRTLLKEYTAAVNAHSASLREYTSAAVAGGDAFIAAKRQVKESREACSAIRKRYSDHVEEHGC
jgi:hypothetical protein